MKISIIGAGNVATHLAKAINAAGMEVVQIWSQHFENAVVLAKQVSATAIDELQNIDLTVDVCLISVKDDEIANIAAQLKDFKGLVAHTSGSVDMTVFEPYFENYGVFYPLQTFSKEKHISFETIPLCLEANTDLAMQVLQQLAGRLSKTIEKVDSEKRKILHLAAVYACNFTNHLYALAEEILEANELKFDILRPLITETAAKVQESYPLDVQTGPAIRNDEQTLIKHQELLKKQPELLDIYKSLSESIKKTR
jgi:predicted short-subunit dehydrogenase-like oxidoreductase (DUF2520 family)